MLSFQYYNNSHTKQVICNALHTHTTDTVVLFTVQDKIQLVVQSSFVTAWLLPKLNCDNYISGLSPVNIMSVCDEYVCILYLRIELSTFFNNEIPYNHSL